MATLQSLGSTPVTVIVKELLHSIAHYFTKASGYSAPNVGDPVFISANGEVDLADAAGNFPIGYVSAIKTDLAGAISGLTVVTNFRAILKCKNTSGGALAAGAYVRGNGASEVIGSTELHPTVTTAASASFAAGVVITGGADDAEVTVGFFAGALYVPA